MNTHHVNTTYIPVKRERWIDTASELYALRCKIRALAEDERVLTDKLRRLSRNETAQGGRFIFEKIERAGAIDYRAIPQLKKVNLDLYRKDPVTVWKLKEVSNDN